MGFPGPQVTSVGNAEHRRAVYNTSVSTNRLDTAQMAMIKYTLTSTTDDSEAAVPANTREEAFGAWLLSTRETSTVAVAVNAGSPWSFTNTNRRWRGASASSKARVILISPVYSPTRKGLRTLPALNWSSYDNQAL
uniref:Uncharacterized protein n=1 Tax=Mus spicilegus TaxID=10103 RepID=A0A8C6H3W5_MUSSI